MINCMLDFVLPSPRFTCASRLFRISHFRTISHLPGKSWNFVTQRKHHSKKPVPAPIFTNPTHATRMFLNINRTMTSVSPPASFGQHDQARSDCINPKPNLGVRNCRASIYRSYVENGLTDNIDSLQSGRSTCCSAV